MGKMSRRRRSFPTLFSSSTEPLLATKRNCWHILLYKLKAQPEITGNFSFNLANTKICASLRSPVLVTKADGFSRRFNARIIAGWSVVSIWLVTLSEPLRSDLGGEESTVHYLSFEYLILRFDKKRCNIYEAIYLIVTLISSVVASLGSERFFRTPSNRMTCRKSMVWFHGCDGFRW